MLPGQAGVCASAEPHGAWGPQGQLPSFEPWIANAVPAMQQKDKGERDALPQVGQGVLKQLVLAHEMMLTQAVLMASGV
eukprot:1137628-Pelagomonas_calceolata.AAC.4